VPIDGVEPAFQTAALTRPDTDNLGTLAFLRALSRMTAGAAVIDLARSEVAA
jgi:hypothetical protein